MTKYFKANFITGIVLRSSTSREYTHAWLVSGPAKGQHAERLGRNYWEVSGFAGREDLAHTAANQRGYRHATRREIVPVEEIDAKTYRALKAAQRKED